jgi:hypothetical protein
MSKRIIGVMVVLVLIGLAACKLPDMGGKSKSGDNPAVSKDSVKPTGDRPEKPADKPAADKPADKPAAAGEIKIVFNGATVTVKKSGSRWEMTDGGKTYTVEETGNSTYKFLENGDQVATGAFKEADKFKFKTSDGKLYMKLKFKNEDGANKIKISLEDTELEPWSLKFKEDKVKVMKGDTELGKVKFYPEDNKLKAKDASEKEVAQTKDLTRLSAALGPYLISELDPAHRNCLILILLAMGK